MIFKTPYPARAVAQLCVGRGTKTGCTCMLLWDRHLSTPNISLLPCYQHSYWEMREGGWRWEPGYGQAGTRQPRHNTVTSCPGAVRRCCKRGGGCAGAGPPCAWRQKPGWESTGRHSPASHPPSFGMRGDRRCEGVQGRLCRPHATGWADAQSRQKTYSV